MCSLKTFTRTAFLVAALTKAVFGADLFEGRVDMAITEAKKKDSQTIAYTIKGARMRLDVTSLSKKGPAPAMIFDFPKSEMIMLIEEDGQKMYMKHPLNMGKGKASKDEEKVSEPVATGRTEKILGYLASEYKMDSDKGESTELWLAKGLGQFMFPEGGGGPFGGGKKASPAWAKIIGDQGFFPLRVVTHDAKGGEKLRMEVTKIDKASVPESTFSTEGYQEFKMPSFGGMGGLPGMGGKDN